MDNYRSLRYPVLWMCLLLVLGLSSTSFACGTDLQSAPASSVEPGLPFAIADFDGDHRPDLASVQTGRSDFSHTDYWIQLQLTTAGRQSIRIVGPAGGLLIEARDVNGDHAVDLVLATAWFRQPIAIFLNDGHGTFSRAEPTAFPGAFTESKTNWGSARNQAIDAVGVPPQSRAVICLKMQLHFPRARARLALLSSWESLLHPFLLSHLGRAPPTSPLQSRFS
jgi:hypothetical protein